MPRPLLALALVLLRWQPPWSEASSEARQRWAPTDPGRGPQPQRASEAQRRARTARPQARRPPQGVVLLAWLGGLLLAALAALLQGLLLPRWPRAELPAGFGEGLRLGGLPLRLVASRPGQRRADVAFSRTLVLQTEGAGAGGPGRQGPPQGAQRLELRLVAVQTRHRSDLAVPRLTRNRPDLQLLQPRLKQPSPRFGYSVGWLEGRRALQTCLTGPGQGGSSEAQLSKLRDRPPESGWPQLGHWLGLADNRDFSCLLVTLLMP